MARRPVTPPGEACEIAIAAAAAVGADLVGVDLLERPDGTYTVIEMNGAVEFTHEYGLGCRDVYGEVARALGLVARDAGSKEAAGVGRSAGAAPGL